MRDLARQGVRLATATAAAFVVVLGFTSQASAVTIVAADSCCSFDDGPFSQAAGTKAEISNPGAPNKAAHNVYSKGTGPDAGPLFYSDLAGPGQTLAVKGTEYLAAGSYGFVCTLHNGMIGTLDVTGGNPAPRPRAVPWIPGQPLKTVRRKGKLTVELRSAVRSGRVTVGLKVGKKTVGSTSVSSLAAGQSRKVSVRLSKSGKRLIAKGRSVKFQARAVAEFGIPATGSRTLRSGGGR